MRLKVSGETAGAVYVVAASGEIDLYSAPELRRALTLALGRGARLLLVDLSETTFIDSTALGVLIGTARRLRHADGELVIACRDRGVRSVFELTRLDRTFPLFDSAEAAISHLPARA
jgi:anti-sigma B factor antagonist